MIPALIIGRKGSTGFPNKNITNFVGRPLMTYPILAAQNSKLVDEIYISTDSDKIIKLSKIYGAEAPFKRPKNLSDDKTRASSVVKHTINYYKRKKIEFSS